MSDENNSSNKHRAVLVGVQVAGVSDEDHAASLAELGRLVKTLGFEVIGQICQKRKAPAASTILGEGKLKELAAWTGGSGVVRGFKKFKDDADDEDELGEYAADVALDVFPGQRADIVVFDNEITPTQLRNLEEATAAEVLDRSGVILEIFSRHARSREARLQVEIAKLGYLAPRLRVSSVGGDRQGGGIGAKGAGETAHELDKRRIRDRIAELRQQLAAIQGEQNTRRSNRREVNCIALVGYTNAGKSSLMRALTGSEVLVADKLFATLDTTVRPLHPESVPKILVSDTVGFIKKLPHDLVASFRSTLDEALSASLLLLTADASDPTFRSQLEVTQTVLNEIGASDVPRQLVLNKVDCLSEEEIRNLRKEFPHALLISTRNAHDVKRVRAIMMQFFEKGMTDEMISIPYTKGHLLGEIRAKARVLSEEYDEVGTRLTVRSSPEIIKWIQKILTR